MLTIGKYRICILDLVCDDRTGKLSSTKIWNHVCNAILCKAILTTPVTWELMTAFGAIVGGSHVATLFLKYKYRDGGGNANKSDSDAA